MSGAPLDPDVQRLLDERRLAEGGGGRRRGFTLSRTEALLRWRERRGVHWAVHLARAANVLSDRSAGIVRATERGMEIEIVHPGFALNDVDLRTIPMSMSIDGTEVSTGVGAACLGHPLHAARWLADTMCARNTPLRAGDVVMTGALGPMQPIGPGQTVTATFGDLGTVTTHVSAR